MLIDRTLLVSRFKQKRINRILFCTPPDAPVELFDWTTAKRGRYANYPPYGVGLLARVAQKQGIECRIVSLQHEVLKAVATSQRPTEFDFDNFWQVRIDQEIEDFKPDLIGVSCMFTMTHVSMKRLCAHRNCAGVPIVIGGVHVTNDVVNVLDDVPEAAIAFLKKSEVAFPTFLDVVNGRLPVGDLCQVVVNIPRSDADHRRISCEGAPARPEALLNTYPDYLDCVACNSNI